MVVFNVFFHCGRTVLLDDLKEEETLESGMVWNWAVAVELQSV